MKLLAFKKAKILCDVQTIVNVRTMDNMDNADDCIRLDAKDIYKEFQITGYDYDKSFRLIESATIKTNIYEARIRRTPEIICILDNVFQTIVLSLNKHFFLPYYMEYIEIDPGLDGSSSHITSSYDKVHQILLNTQ